MRWRAGKEKAMKFLLEKFPAKVTNRVLLAVGLLIFCPVYYFNAQLTLKIVNTEAMKKLYMSFNSEDFLNTLSMISQQGNEKAFLLVFILNIISTIGFLLFTFSLSIIVIRAINDRKIIKALSRLSPKIVFIITALDLVSSVLFILILKNVNILSNLTVFIIDGAYILRVFLLYLLIIWFIFILIYLIIAKKRKILKS